MNPLIFILIASLSPVSLATDSSTKGFWAPYKAILKKGVVPLSAGETAFDYSLALSQKSTLTQFERQLSLLKNFDPKSIASKSEAIAFWVNTYNFSMLNLVRTRGWKKNKLTIDSVKDMGYFFFPYAVFTKKDLSIGEAAYSQHNIENDVLLGDEFKNKKWKDARIHFAINCASVGCPALSSKPYVAQSLDRNLDQAVRHALLNPRHLKISRDGKVWVTQLFDWYESDFVESAGSVRSFILKYLDPKDPKKKKVANAKELKEIPYDWRLNLPENFKLAPKSVSPQAKNRLTL